MRVRELLLSDSKEPAMIRQLHVRILQLPVNAGKLGAKAVDLSLVLLSLANFERQEDGLFDFDRESDRLWPCRSPERWACL